MDKQEIVSAVLRQIETGTVDRELFTADGSWWSNANADFPIAEFNTLLKTLHDTTVAGIAVTPSLMIEQSDVVVVQATSHAPLKNGRIYANRYAFIVLFEGDRIRQVREYSDTAHVNATFDIVL